MKRRYTLLAVLIGLPAALVIIAAIVLPMLADSMYYKRQMVALVKQHTGHDLHIDGTVRLHLLPRLRLTISDLRLANPPGFNGPDLASLPWLAVDVKALPLLTGRIETAAIVISSPTVNLERDPQGRGNWQFAAAGSTHSAGEANATPGAGLGALAIGAVHIRDAALHWRDVGRDETVHLSAIDVRTGAWRNGSVIDDVRVQLTLPERHASVEAGGDATLSATGVAIPKLTATFHQRDLAGMQIDGTLGTRLEADFESLHLTLGALRLSARAAGKDDQHMTVEAAAELDFDLAKQRLANNTLSVKVPSYALSGNSGEVMLQGVLSGDLQAGKLAVDGLRGGGAMSSKAMGSIAFTFNGALGADLQRRVFSASELKIAGSIDGDRMPFQLNADVQLSPQARTLDATHIRLRVKDWRVDGELALHSSTAPPGVRGVFDLRVQDQPLAGSFHLLESETKAESIDVGIDVVADLGRIKSGYALRGRNAVVLRALVGPASNDGLRRVDDLRLGARLTHPSYPGGELAINIQADADMNLSDEVVRSDNLQITFDDSHIAGSVSLKQFDDPALRVDLHADRIDADRYLLPASADNNISAAKPLGVSIEALRALNFAGEIRVGMLTFKGVRMQDVRLTSRASDG
jgi:hypothetical protein